MKPPDFSKARSVMFKIPPVELVVCKCGREFEDNETWEIHARADHPDMFSVVSYNISTAQGVFYR